MLQVNKLACERDDRQLFSGIDFSLAPGEIIQLAGSNGSGKTTLIRILAGLSSGYQGEIFWNDQPLQSNRLEFNVSTLLLGHKPAIKLRLTSLENLRFYCPASTTPELLKALQQVGLEAFEDVPCSQLSAGQQRRVALARLYLSDHPLWLLDEPFTAIDQAGVKAFERLLEQRARAGGMVLLTTHHQLDLDMPFKQVNLS